MNWKPDWGLRGRMALTMFLLLALYIVSAGLLVWYFDGLLIMAGLMGIFLFAQFFFSGKIALYNMGASVVDEDDGPQARKLYAMVGRLPQQADLPKPKVAIADTRIPNALATGHSQKSSAVCITTDPMETLNDGELEGVIAHEPVRVKNRDVMVMTVASFLSSIAPLIVRWGWLSGGDDNHRNAPAIVAIIASFVVWIISYLLIQALLRYREHAVDRGAAVIIGRPSALASALLKISNRIDNVPKRDMRDTSEMNAFFIIPIRSDFIGHLFSTHPSTENRVERLRDMEREMETA